MPVLALPVGVVTTLLQNQVAALPSKACYIVYSAAIEGAQDAAGPWAAEPGAPGAGGGHITGVSFIRCTGGPVTVTVKTT